jgi:hypothetical protein
VIGEVGSVPGRLWGRRRFEGGMGHETSDTPVPRGRRGVDRRGPRRVVHGRAGGRGGRDGGRRRPAAHDAARVRVAALDVGTNGVVTGDSVRAIGMSLLGDTTAFPRRVGTRTTAVVVSGPDDATRVVDGMAVTSGGAAGDSGVVVGYRYTGTEASPCAPSR